ncbi:hypothetical protein KW797_01340 [Candidatus Parcubacteria bacterium]|nr:hypothetical protein [Candidatus Parcubacteria bacterium]
MVRLLILSLLFMPALAFGQEKIENVGFPPGNIWYSKDPFVVGERIDIHTAVFNSTAKAFTSAVEFYDGEVLLGKREVSVLPGGGFTDVSISWKVTEGYHKIYAVLKNASVVNNRTDESEKYVAGAGTASATSSAKTFVTEKLDLAKEYATSNLPAPVVEGAAMAESALEEARLAGKKWSDAKGAELNTKLAAVPKASAADDAGKFFAGAERPLAYVGVFLASIASALFGSTLFFYTGLIALLFFIVRFVKRTFFF